MFRYNGQLIYPNQEGFSFFHSEDPFNLRRTLKDNSTKERKKNISIQLPVLTDLNRNAPEFSPTTPTEDKVVKETESLIKDLENTKLVGVSPPGYSYRNKNKKK